jgi:hypothetical protein
MRIFRPSASLLGVALVATAIPANALEGPTGSSLNFDPRQFFAGRTEGTRQLKVMFRRHRLVHIHGTGRLDPSGSLILHQDVDQAGKPRKHRVWVMRSLGQQRYTATLSDALGPVAAVVTGRLMRLSFAAKGGLQIRQEIMLAPDGQSAENRLTIHKFGLVVATLHEHIVRRD